MKWIIPVGALLVMVWGEAASQAYSSQYYSEEARKAQKFVPLTQDDVGASINLQDGALSFVQNDIELTVSEDLDLVFGRTAGLGGPSGFRSWDLNVPYMVGIYSSDQGWTVDRNNSGRCSSGNFAPGPAASAVGSLDGHNWWRGIQVYRPGEGSEALLNIDPDTPVPPNGSAYYGVTVSNSRVSCLSSIKNGAGEGFVVTTPKGVKYYFDWMSVEPHDTISGTAGGAFSTWLYLSKFYLLATRVEDRAGNYLIYSYEGSQGTRAKLRSISSSDGALVEIDYDTDANVISARFGDRLWSYEYHRIDPRYEALNLGKVINPDRSSWVFSGPIHSLDANMGRGMGLFFQTHCARPTKILGTPYVGYTQSNTRTPVTIAHPSGLVASYEVEIAYTGINQAPGYCVTDRVTRSMNTMRVPFAYMHYAVKSRSISGPGVPLYTWQYSYDQSWSFEGAAQSSDRSRTNITDPFGSTTVYEFGNSYFTNFGKLLSQTLYRGSEAIRREDYEYVTGPQGQAFPDRVGGMPHRATASTVSDWGNEFIYKNRPLAARTLVQDGVTFRTSYSEFDYFARPQRVERSSSVGSN